MNGYYRLAAAQATHTDYAIFRRYMPLHTVDLNRLQAEIAYLWDDLRGQLAADRASGDATRARYECELRLLLESKDVKKPKQLVILDQLRQKLKEYAEAQLRYHAIQQLPTAAPVHQQGLRDWMLDQEGGGDCFPDIEGLLWGAEYAYDLVSLSAKNQKEDAITSFISNTCMALYHQTLGHRWKQQSKIPDPFSGQRQPTPIYSYSDKAIASVVGTCSNLLASMIPALGALALFYIKSAEARMGAIVGLTFSFSVAVSLVAGAGRTECFVATSAFAAVLMVFVGNDGAVCSC
ncbi:uncharacterized protein HMPREF1541_10068 [Cyphellophora europaea CBS 101466]|uniref:DUF6594 domain-containing protein n=1 Tax=Cyphellophora europaea (strain CBS 101466) TaxID=1220924 RepID=W2S8X9_CYPE1|nr:uncharacterized protein HMPREF1541_10068 [Cyphellophora europaea CBS 101466]ETN45191.1 hypothetical protein HMPREF1541_10068 [Cyphellophora europaea CBS 101466]